MNPRRRAPAKETKQSITQNLTQAHLRRYKIRQGISKKDVINRKSKLEAIAKEQKRMGGEIDSKLLTDIKFMSELSGVPMRPFLMTSFEISKELRSRKVDLNRKKVLETELERREA